uniref:Serine peptidase inhibitor, Kazal type 2, tandem duplicate 1 n=1 Tax=Gadus morhua TaxID=8049 RepID=A0A8C5CQT1_GADMO
NNFFWGCNKYDLPACERSYVPVCATDGHTYPNECALCYAISTNATSALIQSRGECPN